MDRQDPAIGLPQRLELHLETPVASGIDRILAGIKPYRELIVLIVAIGTVAVGLHEYFITRLEVRILNCRSLAQIQAIEAKMDMEALREQVARAIVTQPPTLTKGPLGALSAEQRALAEDYVQVLNVLKRNDAASKAMEDARARLKAGICEALVKDNKDL